MAESGAKGDVLQRIAGLAFIVGGILTLVSNALFPRVDDPSNTQEVLIKLADNETLSLIVLLGIAVGIWALMIGVVGVYRSISTGGAAAWTRLGFYGVIVGTTLMTASLAINVATVDAAASWDGTSMDIVYAVAATLLSAGQATFSMSVIVFWMALVFLGVGIIMSDVYAKWLGWSLLVLGIVTMVVGFVEILSDPTQALDLTFGVLAGLTTIWALVIGIIITRRQIQLM